MTIAPEQAPAASRNYPTYHVSVQEYVTFHEQGFLVVRGLVPPEDIQELREHTDNLMAGRETIPGHPVPSSLTTPEERLRYWLRIHMLHRKLPIHERFMLHPRVLDVLQALIGPDVLALQTMLFFKEPGQPGQGYHQDSYYIPTYPDSLCGAWIAIDRADEENGCLWMSVGSQHEPIYPTENKVGQNHSKDVMPDLQVIVNPSNTNNEENGLTPIARKYAGREVPVIADPGDVVFFAGHIIHRSLDNRSNRSRRSFVGHYCNARSWVPWNHGQTWEGPSANNLHILARGTTHLPYAQPQFGTPCAATQPQSSPNASINPDPMSMMPNGEGMMMMTSHAKEMHTETSD